MQEDSENFALMKLAETKTRQFIDAKATKGCVAPSGFGQ